MEIFKLFGSVFIDNDRANQAIDATDNKGKGLAGTFGNVIGVAAKVGAAVVAAGASAAMAIGSVALKGAMNFEQGMSNVATLLDGDVTPRIKELGKEVQQLQMLTGQSSATLQDGLYQVISAFGDSADSMGILETAAKGATAGNASVTDSVNLLAAVTKGYGDISLGAAQKASDLAFQTVKLGQTSFPELASNMGKVIPLASAMKVSQEELFGAMATLTGVTGNTAEVTTQLRGTIQGFMQPTKQMSEALNELGYANGQAALESEGLGGILNKLKDSVGGNELAFAGLFGSVEAKSAVLALTGSQADALTEKTMAMKNATDATNTAFDKQTDNLKGLQARVGQIVDVAMVGLGERLMPLFSRFLDWFEANIPAIQSLLETFFDYFESFVDGLSSLIGTIIEWFKNWYDNNQETISALREEFQTFFTNLREIIVAFIEIVSSFWATWGDTIITVATTAITTVWSVLKNVFGIIQGLLDAFIGLFTGDWSRMKDGLITIWTNLWDGVQKILSGAWDILKTAFGALWAGISGWFIGLGRDAIQWGKDMVSGLWEGIRGMGSWLVDKLGGWAASVIPGPIKRALGISSPSKVFAGFGENIVQGLAEGIEGAKSLAEKASLNLAYSVTPPSAPNPSSGSVASTTSPVVVSFADMFRGAIFNIRSDEDARNMARWLYEMQQEAERAAGVPA